MKGKIIVIDGMDGTGKETQSKLLFDKLTELGYKVALFDFPNYKSDSSFFVKKYLREGYCRDITDIPLLHDMFYSIDRAITFSKQIKEKYEEGYIILLDRYTISNAIFRLDKVENPDEYLMDLASIEHVYLKLPVPDMNIILYSYPEVNVKLIEDRCCKQGDEVIKKDLNETIEVQTKAYDNIIRLSNNCVAKMCLGPIITLIIHDDNDEVYSREKIHDTIMNIIKDII